MASKILVAVVCLAIVQGLNGAVLSPNTCSLQVRQLIQTIVSAATQSRVEISLAIANIKDNIASVRIDVNLQLSELSNKASQATGPNVEKCKKELELALQQLDEDALNLCYQDADLNALYNQADRINNLKGDANQICRTCGTEVNECVTSKVDEILKEIQLRRDNISSGVEDVQQKSNECTRNVRENSSNIINNASVSFDACIQSA